MDHHATTPTDPRVVEAMRPYFTETFGNPASRHHAFGWAARDAVEAARRQVSWLVGCDPREIVFTSGATEANNLAIKGCVTAAGQPGHIVTVATEHRAVLDPCRRLERSGVSVTYVRPGDDGLVDVESVERAFTPETVLLTVMTANNEIGVLQPVAELSAVARRHGVLFHTDATQAVGKVPFNADELDVDLVSLSGHKIYGPKGVGALCVRRRRPKIAIDPLIDGGGHERGLRSGTLNVPAIVGFGRAAEICRAEMTEEADRIRVLRDRLWDRLADGMDGLRINGSMERRLPHNLNISVSGLDGETLLVGLDDVAVSSGAACASANLEPSHVLLALGLPDQLARASLRFGLGRWNTPDEIDYVVEKVRSLVIRLREMSPV
jgi:cysteine desulfurase